MRTVIINQEGFKRLNFGPVRQLAEALESSQWLDSDSFKMHQERLLSTMLSHASAQTDRYGQVLRPILQDGAPDLTRWDEIPFLTRAEAQADPNSITARSVPPNAGGANRSATSGSTARAFPHLRSDLQLWLNSAMTERGHRWFNVDFAGTMASIRMYESEAANSPDGDVRAQSWLTGPGSGTYAMMSLALGTHIQHDWLDRLQPDYLSTYPSIAVALAETSENRVWPSTVKKIFCVGETLSDEQRSSVLDSTGIQMVNSYGASETGLLAFECPESGLLHIMAENAFLEVVNPDGSPTPPGNIGEVVVTTLVNFAMPFIRYKIGDFAETAEHPSPCERSLPVLKRVMGRSRNMFRRPDGSYVWPNVLSRVFNEFVPHVQFRFVQKTDTVVELTYVPRDENQTEDRDAMLAYARERLFPEVQMTYRRATEIPRPKGGKFEDYIREIA